jgi:hypothetical protein
MMLDRRPEHYGLEAKHAYDLWHAGIVRVLDRTRWHDPAGPSLAGLAFSSSEALKRRAAITTRAASARYTERSRGTLTQISEAIRVLDRRPPSGPCCRSCGRAERQRSDLDSWPMSPENAGRTPSTSHPRYPRFSWPDRCRRQPQRCRCHETASPICLKWSPKNQATMRE